jgi:nucleoside-diphosphate-sugar epimerase
MTNILITGGCGFIGSNLANYLCDNNNVTVVDNLSFGYNEFIKNSKIKIINSEFDSKEILNLVEQQHFDLVYHLAAIPKVSYSVQFPVETNLVNVTKTLNLINSCVNNVKRFIFASSSSVYGNATILPTPCNSFKNPQSPYGLQKSIIEDYLKFYYKFQNLDSVCLRFFNVFGPAQLGNSAYSTVLSAWLNSIYENKPLRCDGDGLQTRDMCHVKNIVSMLELCGKHENKLEAQCFNVGNGCSISMLEILNYLQLRYKNIKIINAPKRKGDVEHTLADITTSEQILSYTPIIETWEGITQTCDWYDDNWNFIYKLLNKSL